MRMTEAISLYLDYLEKVARHSPRTIAAYRLDIARFARFLDDPQHPLGTIDAPTVENWVAAMHELSDATVRRALNSLSGLFKWAVRFGYASTNPLDLVPRPKKRRRIPTVRPQTYLDKLGQ